MQRDQAGLAELSLPDGQDVLTQVDIVAELYRDLGRLAEAEPLYKRALEIRERTLPAGHPDIAQSLNNLALLYQAQGRLAEAEPLYKTQLGSNGAAPRLGAR
jgi:tetratricopeptide (TPR) repeat protein